MPNETRMGTVGRVVAGVLGATLLGCGLAAWAIATAEPLWRFGGGAVLVLLGLDALRGAATGREPLILRVGPLP